MPLKLDVDKVLHGKSERVKCVDIHSKEPWILRSASRVILWIISAMQMKHLIDLSVAL